MHSYRFTVSFKSLYKVTSDVANITNKFLETYILIRIYRLQIDCRYLPSHY